MHPGPVNRGVELSGEVVDSPQAVITAQVEAGVVVRMAVLYELLAGSPVPTPRPRAPAGMRQPPLWSTARTHAAELLLTDVHVLDPRAGIDARHDVRVRGGEVAELAPAGTLAREDGEEAIDGRGRQSVAGLLRPPRAPAHARTGAQGGPGDGHPRGRRGRVWRGDRDAQHRAGDRLGAAAALAARRRGARGARARRLPAGDHARAGGQGAERDGRAARAGRARLHRRRAPRGGRGNAAQGAALPAPLRRRAGAARGGPLALARRRDARGTRERRARRRRDPERERVDDGRARRDARGI